MTVWVVGRIIGPWPVPKETHCTWELCGVFEAEADAVAVCRSERHFVGPVEMNLELPETQWPGAYYPLLTENPVPKS